MSRPSSGSCPRSTNKMCHSARRWCYGARCVTRLSSTSSGGAISFNSFRDAPKPICSFGCATIMRSWRRTRRDTAALAFDTAIVKLDESGSCISDLNYAVSWGDQRRKTTLIRPYLPCVRRKRVGAGAGRCVCLRQVTSMPRSSSSEVGPAVPRPWSASWGPGVGPLTQGIAPDLVRPVCFLLRHSRTETALARGRPDPCLA